MTHLPTPMPPGPVPGQPGHFEDHDWTRAGLVAVDSALVTAEADLSALDAAVADLTDDTGWVDITIRAGFAGQSGAKPQVRRIGKVVYAKWGWANTGMGVSATHVVGDIPVGFRPVTTIYVTPGMNNAAQTGLMLVNTNGTVEVRTGSAVATYYLIPSLVWLVD